MSSRGISTSGNKYPNGVKPCAHEYYLGNEMLHALSRHGTSFLCASCEQDLFHSNIRRRIDIIRKIFKILNTNKQDYGTYSQHVLFKSNPLVHVRCFEFYGTLKGYMWFVLNCIFTTSIAKKGQHTVCTTHPTTPLSLLVAPALPVCLSADSTPSPYSLCRRPPRLIHEGHEHDVGHGDNVGTISQRQWEGLQL